MTSPLHRPLDQALVDLGVTSEGPAADWEKRAIEARLFGEPPPPERIGRFVVTGHIGRGGMGDVFAARDEQLDRTVAIKVMTRRTSTVNVERFAREGRALAKLSHANIVQVHEVGQHDGALFIAMEYIEGRTLGAWVAEGRDQHGWGDILRVLLEAGRGLAVAHAAGLVHRDFKPDNVMVGDDGRVRVLDFGLARAIEAEDEHPTDTSGAELARATHTTGEVGASEPRVTVTGALLGTPAYMAPEQHLGVTTTPASDQFSFCVTAYEALYGTRPFSGDSRAAIYQAIESGRIANLGRRMESSRMPPAKVRRVLLRGLALAADDRWPSMDTLLVALERIVAPRRGRGVALTLGTAALATGLGLWHRVTTPRCTGARARFSGAWDEARKYEVRVALLRSGLSYAPATWTRVEQELDRYGAAWMAAYTENCEATRVEQSQSEEVMDLRMACLNHRRSDVAGAVSVLSRSDEETVERAIDIVMALPRSTQCDNVEALRSAVPPPDNLVVAARVAALRPELASARSLLKAGAHASAEAEASRVVDEAESLEYPPLVADALVVRGSARERQANYTGAEEDFERAYVLAVEHQHHATEAEAVSMLTWVVGYRNARIERGMQWGKTALALAKRSDADDDAEAVARSAVGAVLASDRQLEAALVHYQRALDLREAHYGGGHLQVASALDRVADVVWRLGRTDEASALYRRSLAISEAELGPEHPRLVKVLHNLASLLIHHGEPKQALELERRALAIGERTLGPDHPDVAGIVMNLAGLLHDEGKLPEALELHRRALAAFEASMHADHPAIATSLANTGMVLMDMDAFEEALVAHQRALEIRETSLNPKDPAIAMSAVFVGATLHELDRQPEARALLQRAVEMFEAEFGAVHSSLAFPLRDLAKVAMEEGNFDEAVAHASRAVEIVQVAGGRIPKSSFRFVLARALWADPRERVRARALAEEARHELADEHGREVIQRDEIDAWLADHAEPRR